MKILHQDARANEIKLLPETLDDLWHLYNLIDEGDLVFAMTYRRGEEKSDKLRPDRSDKVRMRLGIRTQKVEFHEIEDTDAVIAAVREYGIKEHATITRNPQGKMFDAKPNEEEFLDAVVGKLKLLLKGEPLIILGPGFLKEALAKRLREKAPDLSGSVSVQHTGQAGMAGIQELMKQGIGGKFLEETRVARETRLMEQLFAEIGKGGMFAYGDAQVLEAARSGAVATLLVLDTKVRSKSAEDLLKTVEDSKGEFVVVSSMHEAGRRLESLGGIAAILRYRMS
jgi:protein pelota